MDVEEAMAAGSSGSESGDSDSVSSELAPGNTQLFDRIMYECRHNSPGQCFSRVVREKIERLSPCARRALVGRTRSGSAPLFVASARGNKALVEYLVQVGGAELEQRGVYRAPHERTSHRVTPLWAAAVAGRADTVETLARAGADVDARSDSGSTPLRSACFMSHLEVARLLLERGADVRQRNHNGGTCLINAVQSPLLCRLLIHAGADVNAQDSQLKTALHYAIQEHREDTTRLLLASGADPRLTTRQGDDALQIACIKGAARLVETLARGACSARAADALELLGATQLDEYNDAPAAVASWRAATSIREGRDGDDAIPKRPRRAPLPALGGAREWTSTAELEAHALDADWLRLQALLVAIRVLGPHHKDTLFRLMYRGAAYADALRYSRCVALWSWVLELRIQKDTLLHAETCATLVALTRLLVLVLARGGHGGSVPRAASAALRLLTAAIPECQRLLATHPQSRAQANVFDRVLRCAAHLVYVLSSATRDAHDDAQLDALCRREVRALVALAPCASGTGDTLLHLACSRLTVIRSTYFADEITAPAGVFPSAPVARLLLECGADVSRRNHARSTPLHVAALSYNFSTELVETLVGWGAHLDQPDKFGSSPAAQVQLQPGSRVRPLRHVTLACLAAHALLACARHHRDRLPARLRPFLELHRA